MHQELLKQIIYLWRGNSWIFQAKYYKHVYACKVALNETQKPAFPLADIKYTTKDQLQDTAMPCCSDSSRM